MSAHRPRLVTNTRLAVARGDAPAILLSSQRSSRQRLLRRNRNRRTSRSAGDRDRRHRAAVSSAREIIDLAGACVAPGLIDAHVHIESSLCMPPHFAAAVVPRGVTTVVTDPHEIANVAGVAGVRFMVDAVARLAASRDRSWRPSCVPATRHGHQRRDAHRATTWRTARRRRRCTAWRR